MEIDQLPLTDATRTTLQDKGITELNPPQQQAVESGLLDGDSMIVSSPTASGKTLIATIAIDRALSNGNKALYLVPLKALASEKYRDYKQLFGEQGYNVAMSVGDKDASSSRLASKDLIVMTVEKLDAILRHSPSWVKDVELVVEDEIHLLNSARRGPTLEVTLTRLQELMDFQLLGLSATISNADQLAGWLDATLVDSDYRPVDLKEGIYWQESVEFYLNKDEVDAPSTEDTAEDSDEPTFTTGKQKLEEEQIEEQLETEKIPIKQNHSRSTLNLLDDTLQRDKQLIAFVRSRKSAESEAEKAGDVIKENISREEQQELDELADTVENVLGSPTKQCRRLARCVRNGAAFHHAGLLSKQRTEIEQAFRNGLIKTIAATPTLAAGVSLPAYRIVIRDVKRYTNSGLNYIPVLEYKQMAGRAGRPEHHSEGQAIAVAKNPGMKDDIRDRYVLGEPENVYSKLAVEPVLRMHALSLIATRFVSDFNGLESFFANTFYAHQYGDISEIQSKLQNVVESLEEYGFIDIEDHGLRPTKLGKRVAELYIDPDTAHHMLTSLEQAREEEKKMNSLALLQMLCEATEMRPLLRVKKDEGIELEEMLEQVKDSLLTVPPDPWDGHEYDQFLESFKTALMLQGWIDEKEEEDLMEEFNVTPGGTRAKVEQADWLLYACEEIAGLKGWKNARSRVGKLRTRLQHGIKEELLHLVRFDGIGRVRARRLHDSGIETTSDIRDAGFTKLKKLLGRKNAEKLKEQVGQDDFFDKENVLDYLRDDT